MNLYEKQLNSETVYKGKILTLRVDGVELPDGSKSVRECVRHSGGAAVLLIKGDEVLLVRQYRYLYGKAIYEIPAGKLNDGENAAHAAARELEEETGYRAEVVPLLTLYPSPGYTDEVINVYLAENYRFVGQKPDCGEFLDCVFMPLQKVVEMIESGELCDAKTVAAIYKYLSLKK